MFEAKLNENKVILIQYLWYLSQYAFPKILINILTVNYLFIKIMLNKIQDFAEDYYLLCVRFNINSKY